MLIYFYCYLYYIMLILFLLNYILIHLLILFYYQKESSRLFGLQFRVSARFAGDSRQNRSRNRCVLARMLRHRMAERNGCRLYFARACGTCLRRACRRY